MLIPCGQCRRHVRTSEPACPFCGAAIAAAPTRSSLAGRFSRAAVFAGLASCTSNPPPQHVQQQPPPPDDRVVEQPPPPPPPPPDDTQYAKPPPEETQPPPDETQAPVAAPGGIRGTVHDHEGHRVPAFPIEIRGKASTITDAKGEFTFEKLPPGTYQLIVRVSNNPRHSPEYQVVEVKSGKITRAKVRLPAPIVDRGPCCKPYGAPPARRRVV